MKNALAYFYTQGCMCELYHLEWNFQEQACLHAQMNINAFGKYKETIDKALDFSLHFANDIRTPMMQYYTKKELITALACAEYLGRHYAGLIKNKEG